MTRQDTGHDDGKAVKGWDPQDIKAAIWKRGSTLTKVAVDADLHESCCRCALIRDDNPAADKAISSFLGVPLHELWPDRWDESGGRIRYVREEDTHERERAHRLSSGAA